jgi:hypothetical protein
MHPYISQRLAEARIADQLHQAAAARLARQARLTAHTTGSRTARRPVSHRPAPIEATIPAQRVAAGAVSRAHGATATEVIEAPEMCGAAR